VYVHFFFTDIKPKIIVHPSSQLIVLTSDSDSLLLTCQAVGGTSYYWEKQDSDIGSGTAILNTNTLTLDNITPEAAGDYRCVVSNGSNNTFSDYAKITING